jgi:hypothetical protein
MLVPSLYTKAQPVVLGVSGQLPIDVISPMEVARPHIYSSLEPAPNNNVFWKYSPFIDCQDHDSSWMLSFTLSNHISP